MNQEKNKVGILTLNGYVNFGNRLQNYALEQTIMKMGFAVDTIRVNRATTKTLLERNRNQSIKGILTKVYFRVRLLINKRLINEKKKRFMDFSSKYLHETVDELSVSVNPRNLNEQYFCFVVGSDQVWNPNNLHGTDYFFLPFADKGKRVAYAASFGISELPEENVPDYTIWLKGMNRISVRENDGARIVERVIGKTPPVLVDPTILLDRTEWLSIATTATRKPEGKYLLTYFLGPISAAAEKEIKKTAEKNNLAIVRLADFRDKDAYVSGPSEFIDYLNNCSLVLTDSFHGTVFSVLFEKPFFVFERQGTVSMFSRINTLLKLFHLEERYAQSIEKCDDVFSLDYSCVPPILEAERKRALNYLKESFHVGE